MAGSQQYKDVEILFVLKAILRGMCLRWIVTMFERRFGRRLTENQVRYIKNKYGKDPRFGTPMANAQNFGISTNSNEWPESDDLLEIDFDEFERQEAQVPQLNLRATSFPRTGPPHRPSASVTATKPLRPPKNCPGPLHGREGGRKKEATAARVERGRDGEHHDVSAGEPTGSWDSQTARGVHHQIGCLPRSADPPGPGTIGEATMAARAEHEEEGSPPLDWPANAKACVSDWGDEHTRRGGMEADSQQEDDHRLLPRQEAPIRWTEDHGNVPCGLEIPRCWDAAFTGSGVQARNHEQHHHGGGHAERSRRGDTIDAGSYRGADLFYQQLAALVPMSNEQDLQCMPRDNNALQAQGVLCREHGAHQVIQTSDNSFAKPGPHHPDTRLALRGHAEADGGEESDRSDSEPFHLVDPDFEMMEYTWQTDMASETAPGLCRQNTAWTGIGPYISSVFGSDETGSWHHVEGGRSPNSACLVGE